MLGSDEVCACAYTYLLNVQCEPQIVREGKAYPPMAEKAGVVGDVASKVFGGVMGALRWVSGSGSK